MKNNTLDLLIEKEGWTTSRENGTDLILAYGTKYPKTHPALVHLKRYRTETTPETKYFHMKAAHDYLWPGTVWHSWSEKRFMEHCRGWNYITYAGGASTAKSFDAAKVALLFWLANPKGRAVIVASTSLESLNARIWGYVTSLIKDMAVDIPLKYMRSQPPKILYDRNDTIHGMFAVAAKQGDDESAISSWIGRHPKEAIMVVLDEATDMPPALLKALPNLESGVEFFQCIAIGNSLSKFDLHGALSTPIGGWQSVDPLKDSQWPTTQKNGTCLFFSCYESPAIFESDPVVKDKLSRFLITKAQIEEKEKLYGKDSDSFWRFVLGFWRSSSSDDTVISKEFIDNFGVFDRAEWSGIYPLSVVAGLDPAFSTGGDQCVLRLGVLGQTVSGQIVLDFRGEELLFRIPIVAQSNKSAELQIADQVIHILNKFSVPIQNLCVDANGQGRALGEVIALRANAFRPPIKIYSTRGGSINVKSFDVVIRTNHELWFAFRDFIQHGQIKGLDRTTVRQLTSRLIVVKGSKQLLESKQDYKNRMGAVAPILAHSPDEADACSLALQSAMINYGFSPGQSRDVPESNTLMDEKYRVFKALQKREELVLEKRFDPPVASFLGSLEDYKPPFSS